jgi:hypothetical protein
MFKLVRVSRKVTTRHFRQPLTKKFVTLKYVPSVVETVVTRNVDIQTVEHFARDVVLVEGITLAVKIAIVMFNLESKKHVCEDVPGPECEALNPSCEALNPSTKSIACGWTDVGEDHCYDCRELLQDWDKESHW